tara:strand:+ start:242 stop:847 length:606 start_codon:yes stop_codon:yes gene_type:complete
MRTPTNLNDLIEKFQRESQNPTEKPKIGILMGSKSDIPIMKGAAEALTNLGFKEFTGKPTGENFSFETHIISAHRIPDLLYAYASTAAKRGIEVIIAGAGSKAAHLAGVCASIAYPIPTIGVPIHEESIGSVIGMPKGAPILTVDSASSYNAGLSAVQILSCKYPELIEGLLELHSQRQESVVSASIELHKQGLSSYLNES